MSFGKMFLHRLHHERPNNSKWIDWHRVNPALRRRQADSPQARHACGSDCHIFYAGVEPTIMNKETEIKLRVSCTTFGCFGDHPLLKNATRGLGNNANYPISIFIRLSAPG
jgi:hypothetical protein